MDSRETGTSDTMTRLARPRSWLKWGVAFIVIFVLSLDFWWWDVPQPFGPFRLPRWIYYFVLLQFLLAGVVHLFGRRYWQGEGDDADRDDR